MKKIQYIKTIFTLLCLMTGISLHGQVVASGDINEGAIHWELTTDSVLTITGTGEIPNYSYQGGYAPWGSYGAAIKKLIIGEGITRLGIGSFFFPRSTSSPLEIVEMANTVRTIDNQAFSSSPIRQLSSLKLSNTLDTIMTDAFSKVYLLTEIRLPKSIRHIGKGAFSVTFLSSMVNTIEAKAIGRPLRPLIKVHVEWDEPLEDAVNAISDADPLGKEPYITYPRGEPTTLYVPAGKVDAYKNSEVWSSKFTYIVEDPGLGYVAFDTQGGSVVDTLYEVEKSGSTIATPEPPVKEGYVFDGWYTGTDYITAWDFETSTVVSDTTLYAKWLNAYTVTFDTQGGGTIEPFTGVADGSLITAPENPAKEGFTFDGWYTGADYATAWDFETSTVVSDTTLYAKWLKNLAGKVQDHDGNWYNTVVYGNLEWMVENLHVTHYNDGTEIRLGEYTNAPGSNEDFAVYYMYPNNDVNNKEAYGLLYTWNVAFDHEGNPPENPTPKANFGPEGWRVPTREEWATLGTTDWDGSVSSFLTVTGIPESFNPQFAGDFNTGGYANFASRTEYWLPELVMPAQGYGCRWMYIDASAPTTVAQNQNRNNNCKSIRLVRDVAVLTAIASTGTEVTSLSVYPNTAGEYTVSGVSGAETLMLYDLAGSLVFVQPVENGSSISLSRLAKGIYIAKAGNKAVKLIKR